MSGQNFIYGFSGTDASKKLYNEDHLLTEYPKPILEYFDAQHISFLKQVHGARCIEIASEADIHHLNEGDAQVTQNPKIILAVRTADCVPVLLAHPKVVGVAHAGWKGALGGVIASVVTAMQGAGADIKRIRAVLGPCIRQHSYEVSEDFVSRFVGKSVNNSKFFKPNPADQHKKFFNLPGYVIELLRSTGVEHIHDTGIDTLKDSEFFSYRRATKSGTQLVGHNVSFIALKK